VTAEIAIFEWLEQNACSNSVELASNHKESELVCTHDQNHHQSLLAVSCKSLCQESHKGKLSSHQIDVGTVCVMQQH
jgi:hypothetical protein